MKNEKQMTIKELISARYNGNQECIDAVMKRGEIDFGCNPDWTFPRLFKVYKVKGSDVSTQIGRCISRETYTAFDGETTLRVSYESDSSD